MNEVVRLYLFAYNLMMSIGWCGFFGYLISNIAIPTSLEDPFQVKKHIIVESVRYCCLLQLVASLELVHVITGIVKGSLFATIAQLVGRNHILFCGIYFLPELWGHPCVGWLFVFWGAIEIVRYPTYVLGLYSLPGSELFAWLRYTIFIPLYPLGFSTERM